MTGGRLVGPAVNLYLKQYGLKITQITASGPKGSVSKGDVLKYVKTNKLQPLPQGLQFNIVICADFLTDKN